MKKTLLFLFCFMLSLSAFAQLELVPNPTDINSGTITLKYGEFGDYSIFDPFSDPNLYIYSGLETDGDPTTWDYHDDWLDTSTLIPLTFDSSLGYYVATFNPATRTYIEEPSLATVTVPAGTQVNNWYFIIRTFTGDRQSGDLAGSTYGFTSASVLSTKEFSKLDGIYPLKNALLIQQPNTYEMTIHSMDGQAIEKRTIHTTNTASQIDLHLKSDGIYIVSITAENKKTTLFVRK